MAEKTQPAQEQVKSDASPKSAYQSLIFGRQHSVHVETPNAGSSVKANGDSASLTRLDSPNQRQPLR
jgi:hypothetical protein